MRALRGIRFNQIVHDTPRFEFAGPVAGQFPESILTMRSTLAATALLLSMILAGCSSTSVDGEYLTATGYSQIRSGGNFAAERASAIKRAETAARLQLMNNIMQRDYESGFSIGEAVIEDPFVRAKVFDTIRMAKITDQVDSDGKFASVTIRLSVSVVETLINDYSYGS